MGWLGNITSRRHNGSPPIGTRPSLHAPPSNASTPTPGPQRSTATTAAANGLLSSPERRRLFAAAQASPYVGTDLLGAAVTVHRTTWFGGTEQVQGCMILVGWADCTVAVPNVRAWEAIRIPYEDITGVTVMTAAPDAQYEVARAACNAPPLHLAQARRARLQWLARFAAWDGWAEIAPDLHGEIAALRALRTRAERRQYVQRIGDDVGRRLQGTANGPDIGFHFNLHGGAPEQYLGAGGILASRGDIVALEGGRVPSEQVYYFRLATTRLFDLLNEREPGSGFFNTRMGNVLVPFDLHADAIERARRAHVITDETDISLTFDTRAATQHPDRLFPGIPAASFLTPPLLLFTRIAAQLGLPRISRDEETLAAMRYLAAAFAWAQCNPLVS